MADTDLRKALKDCKKSAEVGYKIASTQEKNLSKVLSMAENRIQGAIADFNSSQCYAPQTAEILERQLIQISDTFNWLSFAFQEDLSKLRERPSRFSITLYGRTQTGKSTLREILTEGDGSSIGKGAQRTTLDVITYNWNGLDITDVPGIGAAVGSEEDEQVAFEAAKTADLILFLITDEGTQPAETECFSRIVDLGKPVIGIMNVKQAIKKDRSLRSNVKNIKSQFDLERLNKIKNQFYQFGSLYGQTWTHIPFIYVHLQSAFEAQQTTNEEAKKNYHALSRIEYLKNRIAQQVLEKGEFYRIKAFIDIISKPLLDSMENLLDQSQINSVQGRTILDKKRQLTSWKTKYRLDGRSQIESLIIRIKSELYGEIAAFAEDHFDDKKADKAWEKLLKERGIEASCQELIRKFEWEGNQKIREVSREITNELRFSTVFVVDKTLRMRRIINGKRVWDWGSIIVGGGLSVATIFATLLGAAAAGPLGIATAAAYGIGIIGSRFFNSKEKLEHEARIKLENNLKKNIVTICANLQRQMEKSLDVIVFDRIERLIKEMNKIDTVIFSLADTQKELAWELNTRLMELNMQLLIEAIRLIGAERLEKIALKVSRVPGKKILILLSSGTDFPREHSEALRRLISTEKIGFVYDTNNMRVLISRVLGREVERSQIGIEEDIGVAYVPLKGAEPEIETRVRLAQQLSQLLIMDQRG